MSGIRFPYVSKAKTVVHKKSFWLGIVDVLRRGAFYFLVLGVRLFTVSCLPSILRLQLFSKQSA